MRPVIRLAAIIRLGRLPAAIAARFACGMCAGWKEADGRFRLVSQQKSNLQEFYGSDGTRTRDSSVTVPRPGLPWALVGLRWSLVARVSRSWPCRRSPPLAAAAFHKRSRAATAGPRFAAAFDTGATGLEPATSGVTGHFDHRNVDDVRCGIALSMRSRPRSGGCLRTAERRRFQAFAGRLLPETIPRAAKSTGSLRCTSSGNRWRPTATVFAYFRPTGGETSRKQDYDSEPRSPPRVPCTAPGRLNALLSAGSPSASVNTAQTASRSSSLRTFTELVLPSTTAPLLDTAM